MCVCVCVPPSLRERVVPLDVVLQLVLDHLKQIQGLEIYVYLYPKT